ncbi:MAG: glycosyltransferase family 1 protein [Candidatus Gottesmanbacteria bacterium]
MIIGIDAGAICEADERLKVGLYRVTFELLRHLSKIDTEHFYRLYSYSPIPRSVLEHLGNTMVNISLAPSVGYMKVRLPLHLAFHPVDVFLGLSQAVPSGAHHAIGFIYDLGFLQAPGEYGAAADRLKQQTEETINRSTHIVTISKASKRDIIRTYHVDERRISVVLPGVSDVFLQPGEEKHCTHPYILSVGLLKPGKHIPLAIQAFSRFLKKTKIPYDFVIIGGEKKADPEIRKTINGLHLEKRVRLLGYIPDEDVAKWYRGAEGLIALSTHEGFCLPAAEALSCGCSVIYINQGALPEIVGPGGIAVQQNTASDISEAIDELSQKTKRTTLGKLAMEQSKKYRWDTFASSVLFLINRVLKENTK